MRVHFYSRLLGSFSRTNKRVKYPLLYQFLQVVDGVYACVCACVCWGGGGGGVTTCAAEVYRAEYIPFCLKQEAHLFHLFGWRVLKQHVLVNLQLYFEEVRLNRVVG